MCSNASLNKTFPVSCRIEFSKDMEAIRNENPDWQYVPTNRLAAELVEPMPRRLRPRNRLKKKVSRHAFILFSKFIFYFFYLI